MTWSDRTFVFGPSGQGGWMHSFAQVPTVLVRDDVLRVYFTGRPERSISLIGYLDLDPADPTRILYVHDRPLLDLGAPGCFDEFGQMPAAVVARGDKVWLYYTGWQRSTNVPYLNAVGLAVSDDGGRSFRKAFPGPVLDRTRCFPISAMSPAIEVRDGVWHCWYAAGTRWIRGETKLEPVYDLKYARSSDGVAWDHPDVTCLASGDPEEALTRPAVLWNDGQFDMWFSFRRSRDFRGGDGGYRIGLARSPDGLRFERDADTVFDVGAPGTWDSEMTAYPCIVDTPSGRLMFYNGNDFGAGGFGFARWSPEPAGSRGGGARESARPAPEVAVPARRDDSLPPVTLFVATYNQEGFVADAVRSALAQDYPRLTILFCDDASTDRTFEIVRSLVDEYSGKHSIRLHRYPVNQYSDSDWYTRIETDICVFGCGDDVFLPHRVSALVGRMIETGVSVVSSNATIIDEDGRIQGMRVGEEEETDTTLETFCRTGYIRTCFGAGLALRMSVWSAFGGLPRFLTNMDLLIPFRGSLLTGAAFVSEPLLQWRLHAGNLNYTRQIESAGNQVEKIKLEEKRRSSRVANVIAMIECLDQAGPIRDRLGLAPLRDVEGLRNSLSALLLDETRQWIGFRDDVRRAVAATRARDDGR